MKIYFAFLFLFLSLTYISCNDDSVEVVSNCIQMMDELGNPIGTYGDCDNIIDQWTNSGLSENECNFLDDNSNLPGAELGPVAIEKMLVYPNPKPLNSSLYISLIADEEVVVQVKMAVVDKDRNVLGNITYLVPTNYSEEVLTSDDFELFYQGGEFYEIYYKVFVGANNEEVFSGHGSFLYCDEPNISNIEDCL